MSRAPVTVVPHPTEEVGKKPELPAYLKNANWQWLLKRGRQLGCTHSLTECASSNDIEGARERIAQAETARELIVGKDKELPRPRARARQPVSER